MKKLNILFFLSASLLVLSCAHTEGERELASSKKGPNREPYSMKGDFKWLNKVQEDFARVAAETSSRSVAARKKDKLLVEAKDRKWKFFFSPENNIFYLKMGPATYTMTQPSLSEDDYFAFVPNGEDANTMSLTIQKDNTNRGRKAASNLDTCSVELSFWNEQSRKYDKNNVKVKGIACSIMVKTINNHVP